MAFMSERMASADPSSRNRSMDEFIALFQKVAAEDLASRFGDLSLSLGEIKDLARDIAIDEKTYEDLARFAEATGDAQERMASADPSSRNRSMETVASYCLLSIYDFALSTKSSMPETYLDISDSPSSDREPAKAAERDHGQGLPGPERSEDGVPEDKVLGCRSL